MKALSLFSGIGGLDLAAEMAGIETVAFCEIEPYAVEVLKRRWPGVTIIDDVRKIRGCDWTVDVVHGGFPCQDLSVAGKQAGLEGERSGLWFEMLRVISEIRPAFVLAENVRGAVNLALDTVYSGLVGEGYKVYPYVIPASAVGAPHKRERLFVVGARKDVADSVNERLQRGERPEALRGEGSSAPKPASQCGQDVRKLWTTPRANKIGGSTSEGYGLCLQEAVNGGRDTKLWRTPDAHCDRGPSSEERMKWKQENKMPVSINDQVQHEGKSKGQLNPDWVEQLMNFPEGWTDLEVDEPREWQGWPALLGDRLWGTHTSTGACRSNKFLENADRAMSPVEFVAKGEYCEQYPYEFPRTTTASKNRAKRLKALGNAVVPIQALPFFEAITWMDHIAKEEGKDDI